MNVNIYHKCEDMMITTLLLPLGHISNTAVVEKFYKNLLKPEIPLVLDYERQILKADARRRRETESSSRAAPQKTVPMLGEQENQSCAPL